MSESKDGAATPRKYRYIKPRVSKDIEFQFYGSETKARLAKIINEGTDAELCGIIPILARFFYPDQEPLKSAVLARSEQLSRTALTEWSNLLDSWFSTRPPQGASKQRVSQGWRDWAKTLTNPETFDQSISLVWEYLSLIPLEEVVSYAPALSLKAIKRTQATNRPELMDRILARTDLDAELLFFYFAKRIDRWVQSTEAHELNDLRKLTQWHSASLAKKLVAVWKNQAPRYPNDFQNKYRSDNLDIIFRSWGGQDEASWREILSMSNSWPDALDKVLMNPNIPTKLGLELLTQGAKAEIKLAIARNPKIRAILKKEVNLAILDNLLLSTMDATEASELLGRIAAKNVELARKALNRDLPEGTSLPKGLLAKIMTTSTTHENRVKLIKNLPKLKVTDDPVPLITAKKSKR